MPRTSFASGAMPGMMKAIQGIAGGGQDDRWLQNQVKMDVAGGQIRHADASTQQALATAREKNAEAAILEGRPGLYEEQAAMAVPGATIPMVQALRKIKSGDASLDAGPQESVVVPDAVRGGIMQALQRLAPMAFNKGDISMDSLAKATGLYADQDREATAYAGGESELEKLRRFEMARGGKDRYSMSPEGRLDQFGGSVDVSAPTTQATIGQRKAAAGASTAAAANSYASAGLHSAQTKKVNQDIELGQKGQYDSQRGLIVNPRTGEAMEVKGPDGKPIQPKDTTKALTEGQAKANLFGTRMQEANSILAQLEEADINNGGRIKGIVEGIGNTVGLGGQSGQAFADVGGSVMNNMPTWLGGPNSGQQRYEQAQRDFINAVLRRESGAAIAPSEFSSAAKQYFPQAGDSKEVIAQKAVNRRRAAELMLAEVPEGRRGSGAPAAPSPPPSQKPIRVNF